MAGRMTTRRRSSSWCGRRASAAPPPPASASIRPPPIPGSCAAAGRGSTTCPRSPSSWRGIAWRDPERHGDPMCGIVGYIGERNATEIILDGLKRLEYRGYDSAGLAVLDGARLTVRRSPGKIGKLESLLEREPAAGAVGLGHTRWATHGRPSEANSHPHVDCSGSLVVVHNGIIENYAALKERLVAEGHHFRSETDTEVIAHLLEGHVRTGLRLPEACRAALG